MPRRWRRRRRQNVQDAMLPLRGVRVRASRVRTAIRSLCCRVRMLAFSIEIVAASKRHATALTLDDRTAPRLFNEHWKINSVRETSLLVRATPHAKRYGCISVALKRKKMCHRSVVGVEFPSCDRLGGKPTHVLQACVVQMPTRRVDYCKRRSTV